MSRWYFQPIFDSYLVVAALATLLLLLLLVRPAAEGLSKKRQYTLSILRGVSILLLTIGMLRPSHISTESRPQSATLVVLYDQSRSMQVADAGGEKTRWQSQRDTLQSALPNLNSLTEMMEVKLYTFDETVHAVELPDEEFALPREPLGEQTDIGSALDEVVRRESGKRLAGVVLLTDGAQRANSPRVEMQQAARDLARLGYPLFTIGFGRPGDKSESRDVAVENMQDQYTVFVKNELVVRALLRVQGFVKRPIPVRLLVEGQNGNDELGPSLLSVDEDGQQVEVKFSYTPQEAGQYKLTLQAEEQPGELVVENNQLTAFLNVLEGGLKVLMLYGNLLDQEQKFMRLSIDSSPDIKLDDRAVDLRLRDRWPIDLGEELGDQYDVYVVSNVDASALGTAQLQIIADQVAHGKGLVMTGGPHAFGPGGYRATPLESTLPVRMGRFERQELDPSAPLRKDLHIDQPLRMVPAMDHFLTHLAPAEENDEVWRRLKPLTAANRFSDLHDRAILFASSEDGTPLLVGWQPAGDGRVLAFAGDSTYRWWRYGQRQQHKRFWRQVILWLGHKDEALRRDVWVRLARRRFRPGDPIRVTAGARGSDGDPVRGATLKADLVSPDGKRAEVRLSPTGDDWEGLIDDLQQPGDYRVEIIAKAGEEAIGKAVEEFAIVQRDLELSDPAAQPEQLQMLSKFTEASGGKALAPEQLPALIKQLREQPSEMTVEVQSKWQLGGTRESAWSYFVILVVLLGVEWFLRKNWNLV